MSARLKEAEKEMAAADEYDYLVINEDLEKAIEEVKAIIEEERKNRAKHGKNKGPKEGDDRWNP